MSKQQKKEYKSYSKNELLAIRNSPLVKLPFGELDNWDQYQLAVTLKPISVHVEEIRQRWVVDSTVSTIGYTEETERREHAETDIQKLLYLLDKQEEENVTWNGPCLELSHNCSHEKECMD